MSQPFIGEIRHFGFPRVPTGWQACDGSLLSIAEYETLYTLLGTTYGGDGANTFGVPDLRGQAPVHQGNGIGLTPRVLGQGGGQESVTLTTAQIPQHTHTWMATQGAATTGTPGNTVVLGAPASDNIYVTDITGYAASPLSANSVQPAGGNLPHGNMMPTLTVNICISLYGIWPAQQ
jgi:microcystin-dependent protein